MFFFIKIISSKLKTNEVFIFSLLNQGRSSVEINTYIQLLYVSRYLIIIKIGFHHFDNMVE